jgi:hypothetical protein
MSFGRVRYGPRQLREGFVETHPGAFLPRQKEKGPLISQRPFGKQ